MTHEPIAFYLLDHDGQLIGTSPDVHDACHAILTHDGGAWRIDREGDTWTLTGLILTMRTTDDD